jgi:hypothetical protein
MANNDWRNVPMPPRIAVLPRDVRGYPITFVTLVTDSGPDFTTLDGRKISEVVKLDLCGLCGGPRGAYMAFVGGPKSIEGHQFFDPPMHRDCALYATQVCPFIVIPTARYSKPDDDVTVNPLVDPNRPTEFFLAITKKYAVVTANAQAFFLVGEYESVTPVRLGRDL